MTAGRIKLQLMSTRVHSSSCRRFHDQRKDCCGLHPTATLSPKGPNYLYGRMWGFYIRNYTIMIKGSIPYNSTSDPLGSASQKPNLNPKPQSLSEPWCFSKTQKSTSRSWALCQNKDSRTCPAKEVITQIFQNPSS